MLNQPPIQANHADPAVTSLDPLETNRQSALTAAKRLLTDCLADAPHGLPRRDLLGPNFRHSGWAPTRDRVFLALRSIGTAATRLDRFEQCGQHAWVMRSIDDDARLKLASDKCHDRFCLPCANERSRTIARRVCENLDKQPVRMLTLTLAGTGQSLQALLALLTKSFSRLRTRKLWRDRVTGGVAFLEVKRSSRSPRWNVHFHVLTQGKFILQSALSRAWKSITGDSFIVDIRLVKNPEITARYVSKYASKPMDPSLLRDDVYLAEALRALAGKRLCLTFGSWRGVCLTEPYDDGDWEAVCSLAQLLAGISRGNPADIETFVDLRRSKCLQTRAPPQMEFSYATTHGT